MVASESFCADTFLNDVKGFQWKTAPSSENQARVSKRNTLQAQPCCGKCELKNKTKLNKKRLTETELKRMVARGWGWWNGECSQGIQPQGDKLPW